MTSPVATKTLLHLTGMRGNRCRECVVAAVEAVAGVRDVSVNLFRASATIVHERHCSASDLVAAVSRAGYRAAVVAATKPHDAKGPKS